MDAQLRRLKAIIDQAEVDEAREELDHNCWVVVQRWDERQENLLQLTGPFPTPVEPFAAVERLRVQFAQLDRHLLAKYGVPAVEVLPVLPD